MAHPWKIRAPMNISVLFAIVFIFLIFYPVCIIASIFLGAFIYRAGSTNQPISLSMPKKADKPEEEKVAEETWGAKL